VESFSESQDRDAFPWRERAGESLGLDHMVSNWGGGVIYIKKENPKQKKKQPNQPPPQKNTPKKTKKKKEKQNEKKNKKKKTDKHKHPKKKHYLGYRDDKIKN